MAPEPLAAAVFLTALALLVYLHFGYPALLWALARLRPRPVRAGDIAPRVDLLIGAYNEEAVIRQKIENCLAQDYPRERFTVTVASDASTDGTDAAVLEYAGRGVRLVRAPFRRGKAANFRETIRGMDGDVVLFSDASSLYRSDTIRRLVRHFADPEVGCVGGRIRYLNPGATTVSQGEGLYWRYEVLLRELESAVGSTVVLSGAVYAIRRDLYREVPDHLPDDFLSPLNVLDQGYRVIYDTGTEILERMATSTRSELATKIRIIGRNFRALLTMKHLLNPFRDPLLALQLFSHRLLRWFVLPLAAVLFVSNLFLAGHPLGALLLAGQVLFYTLAGVGYLLESAGRRWKPAMLPFYFVLVNLAAAIAVGRLFLGRAERGVWEPVER
jgi:cellulose synthase/poly-beta-1,6-N-acetylglucosamine synthase-like glycosyltransferase